MSEPAKKRLRAEVLERLSFGTPATDEDVYREIDRVILEEGHRRYGSLREKEGLREELFNSIRRMDVLEKYLRDESVTEIMVIGEGKIFVEQNGRLRRTEDTFADREEVYRLIDQIVAPTNRAVNESEPIVDGRLADGSRVHIVLPPISLEGPVLTIRKFCEGGMTMEKLEKFGEFPPELSAVLSCLVRGRYSILISGATNSGKSSLLNALAEYILPDERIVTIEDSAELQFGQVDNLVRLETRNANAEGEHEVTMNDLIKASLRMRPTRIIVGEVRGAEAISMLQALSTGHQGSFSSIHANSCRDALRRLEVMTLMGINMNLTAIQGQIGSAIDILIHLDRLSSGQRKVMEIYELLGYEQGDYLLNPLFEYRQPEKGEGCLMARKCLRETKKLKNWGQYTRYCRAMEAFPDKEEGCMDSLFEGGDAP